MLAPFGVSVGGLHIVAALKVTETATPLKKLTNLL